MNKTITYLLILALGANLFFTSCDAEEPISTTEITWLSFDEVQKKMKKKPKKVFIDVYTHWCGPCKMMDRTTFANPFVIKYLNENFYAVKFNAQEENPITFQGKNFSNPTYDPNKGQMKRNGVHQLSSAFGVRAYPTLVVLDETLNLLQAIPGMKTPQTIEPMLKYYAGNNHKATPYNDFIASFKSEL